MLAEEEKRKCVQQACDDLTLILGGDTGWKDDEIAAMQEEIEAFGQEEEEERVLCM